MNIVRRVYISDTPRCFSYERVRHSFIDVDDGYANTFMCDSFAFSLLQLYVIAFSSGGE